MIVAKRHGGRTSRTPRTEDFHGATQLTRRRAIVASLSYLIFLLSGAAALVYEISRSRQIGLSSGHTVECPTEAIGVSISRRMPARLLYESTEHNR